MARCSPRCGPPDPSAALPRRHRGRGSTEAGSRSIPTICTPAVRDRFHPRRHRRRAEVTHPSAIVWAAQMGTVTSTPGRSAARTPTTPTSCAVGPRPAAGNRIAEARTARRRRPQAAVGRTRSGRLPKTSGGRGVHVFPRIRPDWDFVAVRRAGIALAREIERRAPELVTTSWWKEERGRRLFIDLQPERPRPHAPPPLTRCVPPRSPRCRRTADVGGTGWRRSD